MAASKLKNNWWAVLSHSVRTAITAMASFLIARLFRLPEAYWAPITTLVITQSSLGTALAVSWQRFVGTILGALVGAVAAAYFGPHVFVFGVCVLILGFLCVFVHSDRSAYRFAGVTLGIVLLIPRTEPPCQIALHRFAEVSIGIGAALLLTMLWPETADPTSANTKFLASVPDSDLPQTRPKALKSGRIDTFSPWRRWPLYVTKQQRSCRTTSGGCAVAQVSRTKNVGRIASAQHAELHAPSHHFATSCGRDERRTDFHRKPATKLLLENNLPV